MTLYRVVIYYRDMEITQMTKQEAYELIDAYEADPSGSKTCDNLCTVADALDLDEGEYQSDELREMVAEQLEDEADEDENIEAAGPASALPKFSECDDCEPNGEWLQGFDSERAARENILSRRRLGATDLYLIYDDVSAEGEVNEGRYLVYQLEGFDAANPDPAPDDPNSAPGWPGGGR